MNFFSKSNPWFSACFKFLMSIKYLVLSCNLATNFSTFSIFILSGKNGKSWWSSCKFSRYWKSASLKYPLSLSSFYIFMKFSLNWEVSLMRSKLFIGRFCDIPNDINYLIQTLKIWWFFLFMRIFLVFVIIFCISINRVSYSSSNTFFYH